MPPPSMCGTSKCATHRCCNRPALTLAQAIEAPLRGFDRAEQETGTKVGVIVCGIRTMPPATSLELAQAAADYRAAGVIAFDLGGPGT